MKKIASFTINHDILGKGMYTSRVDGDVITYDIRMKLPNNAENDYLTPPAAHTFEHLFATYVRNTQYSDQIVYVGPMGCLTGFYFLVRDTLSPETAIRLVQDCFAYIAEFDGEIPGNKRIECGNYKMHDLAGAREIAKDMCSALKGWTVQQLVYPAE
ncbi:MAG: S-ribosylhomocysteine lyase [Ruminococcus sp.]|jgi:S-ribosylhomocysteine lyase|nr:S-ribosylhomocysteine lyase [Ruminococcus sp.]